MFNRSPWKADIVFAIGCMTCGTSAMFRQKGQHVSVPEVGRKIDGMALAREPKGWTIHEFRTEAEPSLGQP